MRDTIKKNKKLIKNSYKCFLMFIDTFKARFKRRILHVPSLILILVDSNEYVRLIWFKRRIFLPNKIAERD